MHNFGNFHLFKSENSDSRDSPIYGNFEQRNGNNFAGLCLINEEDDQDSDFRPNSPDSSADRSSENDENLSNLTDPIFPLRAPQHDLKTPSRFQPFKNLYLVLGWISLSLTVPLRPMELASISFHGINACGLSCPARNKCWKYSSDSGCDDGGQTLFALSFSISPRRTIQTGEHVSPRRGFV